MGVAAQLLGLLAPPRCVACGDGCEAERSLCPGCTKALALARPVSGPSPPGLDVCWSAGSYDGVVRALVTAIKFGRLTAVARVAAEAMAGAPDEVLDGVLVPVPPAPRRLRGRGFDPAHEIAVALASLRGLPLAECLRRADGPRQVGRPRAERTANPPRVRLDDRFLIAAPTDDTPDFAGSAPTTSPVVTTTRFGRGHRPAVSGVPPQARKLGIGHPTRSAPARAVLIDDVWTTGATLTACARALREAGSTHISALTLAHTQ